MSDKVTFAFHPVRPLQRVCCDTRMDVSVDILHVLAWPWSTNMWSFRSQSFRNVQMQKKDVFVDLCFTLSVVSQLLESQAILWHIATCLGSTPCISTHLDISSGLISPEFTSSPCQTLHRDQHKGYFMPHVCCCNILTHCCWKKCNSGQSMTWKKRNIFISFRPQFFSSECSSHHSVAAFSLVVLSFECQRRLLNHPHDTTILAQARKAHVAVWLNYAQQHWCNNSTHACIPSKLHEKHISGVYF